MICKLCGQNYEKLGNHLYHSHKNITYKDYYDMYIKQETDGICKICGSPTLFNNRKRGYNNCCCNKCKNIYTYQQTKKAILAKYNVENPFQSKELMEDSYKNKDYKKITEKTKQTKLLRYNDPGFSNNKKREETCLTKYGFKAYTQTEEFKNKAKNTKLIKYNDENYTNLEKARQTFLKHYNVEHYSQTDEFIKKVKQTKLERYGDENYVNFDKIKKTNLIKYGTEFYLASDDCKQKTKEFYQKNYGVDCYAQTDEFKNRTHNKAYTTYKYANMLNFKYNGEICTCFCDICKKEFDIDLHTLRARKTRNHILCTYCNPLEKQYSTAEKEVCDYIKSIYNGLVIENDRTVLNGKEIDIYLPDLKLGFEFDGTYWHADPRFYNADDIIDTNGKTAQEIWEKDKDKEILAESLGIKLVRIKEYDWVNNRKNIEEELKKLIL